MSDTQMSHSYVQHHSYSNGNYSTSVEVANGSRYSEPEPPAEPIPLLAEIRLARTRAQLIDYDRLVRAWMHYYDACRPQDLSTAATLRGAARQCLYLADCILQQTRVVDEVERERGFEARDG